MVDEKIEDYDDKFTFQSKFLFNDALFIVDPPPRGSEMSNTLEENADYMDKEVEK